MLGVDRRAQIAMSEGEITQFVEGGRTATMATVGPDGSPHLVAMWYAVIDGDIWFETKTKSQKAVNLRRDNRISCLFEDGLTYESLRGVSMEGTADILDDPDVLWTLGIAIWERYQGLYTDEMRPGVEAMMHNRVAVHVNRARVRSWDHRKLGLPATAPAGSTAPNIGRS